MAMNSVSKLRFSGIASGMDTDTIISQLMKVERMPIDKMYQKRQVEEWKSDQYREMTSVLKGFNTDFLDVLSTVNMRSQNSYKKFSASAVNSAGSTSTAVSVKGSVSASAGAHTIDVNSLATSEELNSSKMISKAVKGNMGVYSFTNGKDFVLSVDGVSKTIEIDSSISSVSTLNTAIANKFGENKVQVTTDGLNLTFGVVSGSGVNKVSIAEGDSDGGLQSLGFYNANTSNRINTSTTLDDLKDSLSTTFSFNASDEINITINGAQFEFSSDTTINSMMNQINSNDDANVYMKYDEISDTFKFVSKQTGKGSNIEISETGSTFFTAIGMGSTVTGTSAMPAIGSMNFQSPNKKLSVTIDGVTKEITLDTDYSGDPSYATRLLGDIESKIENEFSAYSVNTTVSQSSGYLSIALNSGGTRISFGDPTTVGATSALTDLGLMESHVSGMDASVELDGVTLARSDNTFAVDGITYTLNEESEVGKTEKVTLALDVDTVYDNISKFVEKYNELISKLNSKVTEEYDRNYLPLTDEQKASMSDTDIEKWETKAQSGLLRNDSILETTINKFRSALYETVSGVSSSLTSIGISTGAYTEKGKLFIDETKLKTAIAKDPDNVMNLFSKTSTTLSSYSRTASSSNRQARNNEEGLAHRLYDIIQDNISTLRDSNGKKGYLIEKAGLVSDSSEFSNDLFDSILDYTERISSLEDRLGDKENAYYRKFSAMEAAMSKMNSQKSWLSQQLGSSGG